MTVGEIIAEPLRYAGVNKAQRRERVAELLSLVGLKSDHINRYPHEFSGGQRQRIGIARALAGSPKFIVCDEPISALDVSIQAQVINMLEDLQNQFGLTYLFVSHDLSMVRHISHRVGVMYLGRIMEEADVKDLYRETFHPYTKALFSAAPVPDPDLTAKIKRIILQGDVPTPINTPPGCPFRSRCPDAKEICADSRPELRETAPGHYCACHFVN
jgi:oligopeptide transport system ATP-binding protein